MSLVSIAVKNLLHCIWINEPSSFACSLKSEQTRSVVNLIYSAEVKITAG